MNKLVTNKTPSLVLGRKHENPQDPGVNIDTKSKYEKVGVLPIRTGSTPTFSYFDLYLCSVYAAYYVNIRCYYCMLQVICNVNIPCRLRWHNGWTHNWLMLVLFSWVKKSDDLCMISTQFEKLTKQGEHERSIGINFRCFRQPKRLWQGLDNRKVPNDHHDK